MYISLCYLCQLLLDKIFKYIIQENQATSERTEPDSTAFADKYETAPNFTKTKQLTWRRHQIPTEQQPERSRVHLDTILDTCL